MAGERESLLSRSLLDWECIDVMDQGDSILMAYGDLDRGLFLEMSTPYDALSEADCEMVYYIDGDSRMFDSEADLVREWRKKLS